VAGLRRTFAVMSVVAVAVFAAWLVRATREHLDAHASEIAPPSAAMQATAGLAEPAAASPEQAHAAQAARRVAPTITPLATVAISGRVIDDRDRSPVAGADVVLRSVGRSDLTARTRDDGTFALAAPPGLYRIGVRGAGVQSTSPRELERLIDAGEDPGDSRMLTLRAFDNISTLELAATREGVIVGRVIDPQGRPVAGARVHAAGGPPAPAFATDSAQSDDHGVFELRVAPGRYSLDANSAPPFGGAARSGEAGPFDASTERFTGAAHPIAVDVHPGANPEQVVQLVRGCTVTGRVVRSDGTAAADGAIERAPAPDSPDYAPAGRIAADGTFRWTSAEHGNVTLRAWPWKSPPTGARTFTCDDGTRIADVVLRVSDEPPVLEGTIVDADGAPVPHAFVDIFGDGNDQSQQERGDANGHWQAFHLPAGRYRVDTSAPGKGFAATRITAPSANITLQLSGTGRIEGTTTPAIDGVLRTSWLACVDRASAALVPEPRAIVVTAGRFAIDDAPACELAMLVGWRDVTMTANASVAADQIATVELDLSPARPAP
jgi:hypothetical protein